MAGSKKDRGILPNIKTLKLKNNVSGMAQNKAETFLRPDQAIDIINMHSTEEASWSADNIGYTKINSGGTAYESGASVDGLHWLVDSDGASHLYTAINGKLKEINTSTGVATDVDAVAGYALGSQVDFQAINGVLFTVDGSIAKPRKWDPITATASDSGGWPLSDTVNTYSKPKFVEKHQDRAVYLNFQAGTGAKSKYPSHLAIMNLTSAETCTIPATTAIHGYIAGISDGDGEEIVGARWIHIPATNETQLVIFKDRSTHTLTGQSALLTDPDQFGSIRMNGNYGALNNRCILEVGKDIIALNEYGITSYSSSSNSGTIQPSAINSDLIRKVIKRFNRNVKEKAWGIHIPDRREVIFFIPTGASSQCNEAIVYKYPSPGDQTELPKWSRRTDVASKFKMSHGVLVDDVFYIGSYTGIVGTMFTASNYDGTGIPYVYEFAYWDMGNEKQNKSVVNAEAQFKVRSVQNCTMQTKWKGGGNNNITSNPLMIGTTVSGAVYGQAVYGVSSYGSSEEIKVPYKVDGNGTKLKHKLSGTTTTSGPEFLGCAMIVQVGSLSGHYN